MRQTINSTTDVLSSTVRLLVRPILGECEHLPNDASAAGLTSIRLKFGRCRARAFESEPAGAARAGRNRKEPPPE
jgi:hypothetical protein